MKHNLLFLGFILLKFNFLNAQVYVNPDAVGANNGTSWANAYTSLEYALDQAVIGQDIWVIKGIFRPDSSTAQKKFILKSGTNLYGGFAGTETALDQRNLSLNETLLSADMKNDDIPNNFITNRSDNLRHVIETTDDMINTSVVDGISFKGGHGLISTSLFVPDSRSAAIGVYTNIIIRNCYFSQNFSSYGACLSGVNNGLFLTAIKIEHCVFENNAADKWGGAITFYSLNSLHLANCTFKDNVAGDAGAIFIGGNLTKEAVIKDCTFTNNNVQPSGAGGALVILSLAGDIDNCTFTDNKAMIGGSIYLEGLINPDAVNFTNCMFKNNQTSTGNGGAICMFSKPVVNFFKTTFEGNKAPVGGAISQTDDLTYGMGKLMFDSCYFYANNALGTSINQGGGAMYMGQIDYEINNCQFVSNKATSQSGALVSCGNTLFKIRNTLFKTNSAKYDGAFSFCTNSAGQVSNCNIESNKSTVGNGGAGSCLSYSTVRFDTCTFWKNSGKQGAGLVISDHTDFKIFHSLFDENTAIQEGGGILVIQQSTAEIEDCTFQNNKAASGGALFFDNSNKCSILNSVFLDNYGNTRGGCGVSNNTSLVMTNCLIANNKTGNMGHGGAFGIQSNSTTESSLSFLNCTIANNSASDAVLSQLTTGNGKSSYVLQNTLIQQDGKSFSLENGTAKVLSTGGNQSSDSTLVAFLTGPKDEISLTSTFVNVNLNDYHLLDGPGVDGGVTSGAPLTDLEGNPRLGAPDRGCYEYGISRTQQIGFRTLPLKINPNPVTDQATISLDNPKAGNAEIAVWDQQGRCLITELADKYAGTFTHTLNVSDLEAGAYRVRVTIGATVHEGLMVKIR